ncbi:MAG: hypothetical protein Q8K79_13145 [Solirubrobacteraceae bacterium]|nr:hypothetical protein [Solirubrobacteraceae bacterium]
MSTQAPTGPPGSADDSARAPLPDGVADGRADPPAAGATTDPPPAAAPPPEEGVPSARRALELVGLVVAPTTLVTALAYYFGWVLTNSRARYFGIDASALGYSTQDYLLRSADALFVPLGAVIVLALAIVSLHAAVTRVMEGEQGRRRLRVAARGAIGVGALLFAFGVVAVFEPVTFSPHYLFASSSPGVGIALVAYGVHLLERVRAADSKGRSPLADVTTRRAAVALVALLIVLSGFWTASEYADALGRGRAQSLAAGLGGQPSVTVFSPRRLHIDAPGVTERRLTGRDRAYGYRYAGLRMLVRSNGKYFLVPDGWRRGVSPAIVLADSADYRFEFGSGRR